MGESALNIFGNSERVGDGLALVNEGGELAAVLLNEPVRLIVGKGGLNIVADALLEKDELR